MYKQVNQAQLPQPFLSESDTARHWRGASDSKPLTSSKVVRPGGAHCRLGLRALLEGGVAVVVLSACSGGNSDTARDAGDAAQSDLPSASALESWLQPVFDQGYVHGMTIGLIDRTGTVVHGYGSVGDAGVPPGGDTIFQIGSVTKTFTGLWLATELVDGGLHSSDPVQGLLPSSLSVPSYQGTAISLEDLATHTSGLPAAPTNVQPADRLNPYADYTVQDLGAFLGSYSLSYAPGTTFVYSNVGEGLLGLALSLRAGVTYNDGIQSKIAGPLGLVDTTTVLSTSQQQRLAPGYDGDLNAIEPMTFNEAIIGMGGLRSTVDDLLKYVAAQAGLTSTPLAAAMTLSHHAIHPTTFPGYDVGLNWFVAPDGKTIWHSGTVYGAMAFVGFDPDAQKAAVVLVDTDTQNTVTSLSYDPLTSIGFLLVQWLQGKTPPPLTSIFPSIVSLTPAQLQPFVGTYDLAGGGSITVTLQGNRLMANAPAMWGLSSTTMTLADLLSWPRPFLLYATSANAFLCREVDARVAFATGADGGVDKLTMQEGLGGTILQGTKQ